MPINNKQIILNNTSDIIVHRIAETNHEVSHCQHTLESRIELCQLYDLSNNIDSLQELFSLFSSIGAEYGFDHCATFSYIPTVHKNYYIYLANKDWKWVQHYRENKLFKKDPSIRYAKERRLPYTWEQAEFTSKTHTLLTPTEYQVVTDAISFGMTQVVNIPFQGLNGDYGVIRYIRVHQKPLSHREIKLFFSHYHLLNSLLYEQKISLLKEELGITNATASLSKREKEVLELCAFGKNPANIADQLNMSESTVCQHLRNVRSKFGVRNTTHAMSKAIACGEITI